jgi:hypothetical protein
VGRAGRLTGTVALACNRHSVRHLLLHVVTLLNRRAAAGRITRFIKVLAHRGEPLNEAADALAAAAADSDPGRPVAMDLDPEAVHFMYREAWVEWDAKVREDPVQRAAELCLNRMLRPKRGRAGTEASPPALPLTAAWMLRPNQGWGTQGKVLGDMSISTAKNQVLQSIAGAFPCNAVLHKWGITPSPACALCGHPAKKQSHVHVRASRAVPPARARISLCRPRVILGSAAGGHSRGRTRCALLTRNAFAGPRPFGGAGLGEDLARRA